MKIGEISEYIINRFSTSDREWLNDCLLGALEELYRLDELTALEEKEKLEERVKSYLRSHMNDCRKRRIPPLIRLSDDEVVGRQRPKVMVKLQETLRSMNPYEFQRLCCLYIQEDMGYSVHTVKRRDKGADIIAKRDDISLVAQVRRHEEKSVGRDELDQWVLKVQRHYPGSAFVFLSATSYTNPARRYAGQVFVTLIDGEQIAYFLSKKDFAPLKIEDWLNDKCQACRISKCELKPI
jgi:restriction endonuclease Mrr